MNNLLSMQDHYKCKDKYLPFVKYAIITMCFTGYSSSACVKLSFDTDCSHSFNTTSFVIVFSLEQFSITYKYTLYCGIILGFFLTF
jgi:hypothetical protein